MTKPYREQASDALVGLKLSWHALPLDQVSARAVVDHLYAADFHIEKIADRKDK